jgi:hypothetical protein
MTSGKPKRQANHCPQRNENNDGREEKPTDKKIAKQEMFLFLASTLVRPNKRSSKQTVEYIGFLTIFNVPVLPKCRFFGKMGKNPYNKKEAIELLVKYLNRLHVVSHPKLMDSSVAVPHMVTPC